MLDEKYNINKFNLLPALCLSLFKVMIVHQNQFFKCIRSIRYFKLKCIRLKDHPSVEL